jgi:predicted GNAT family N-acyltransferase
MKLLIFRTGEGESPAAPPGVAAPDTLEERERIWERVRELRTAVFVDEQGVDASLEFDGLDDAAIHIAFADRDSAVGTTRILMSGDVARVGRMAVDASRRRQGLGRRLVGAALDVARLQGAAEAVLHAQSHARGFYESMGFSAEGAVFEEAGIEHVAMRRVLAFTADPD